MRLTVLPAPLTPAPLTPAELAAFLGGGLRVAGRGLRGLDNVRLLPAPHALGGTVARVSYPAGSASPAAGGTAGGMQAYLTVPGGPRDVATLAYSVRFPDGFDFVRGGKLPGLYGGTVTGGRVVPDGENGFSTRYMWRAGGAGEVYAYLPTSVEHGTSLGRGSWTFRPGEWTRLHQRVQLNTPGVADGRITVRQDGRRVLDVPGLLFRTSAGLGIEGLFMSTFFGGGDTSWASPSDQYADFAGFTMSGLTMTGADAHAPAEQATTTTGGPPCG